MSNRAIFIKLLRGVGAVLGAVIVLFCVAYALHIRGRGDMTVADSPDGKYRIIVREMVRGLIEISMSYWSSDRKMKSVRFTYQTINAVRLNRSDSYGRMIRPKSS
jgi:hypothetical protein